MHPLPCFGLRGRVRAWERRALLGMEQGRVIRAEQGSAFRMRSKLFRYPRIVKVGWTGTDDENKVGSLAGDGSRRLCKYKRGQMFLSKFMRETKQKSGQILKQDRLQSQPSNIC